MGSVNLWLIGDDVMFPTSGLIGFLGSDENDGIIKFCRLSVDKTLCPGSCTSADGAGSSKLGDEFSSCKKLRHRTEGFAPEVRIKPGYDDTDTSVGKLFDEGDDAVFEELDFIDGDDLDIRSKKLLHVSDVFDGIGGEFFTIVGCDGGGIISVVDGRFEGDDFLMGIGKGTDSSDEFFALPGKHRTTDDFQPTFL